MDSVKNGRWIIPFKEFDSLRVKITIDRVEVHFISISVLNSACRRSRRSLSTVTGFYCVSTVKPVLKDHVRIKTTMLIKATTF